MPLMKIFNKFFHFNKELHRIGPSFSRELSLSFEVNAFKFCKLAYARNARREGTFSPKLNCSKRSLFTFV